MKRAVKTYIKMEKTSVLRYKPHCFYKESQLERTSKYDRFPTRDNNPRKSLKRLTREQLTFQ